MPDKFFLSSSGTDVPGRLAGLLPGLLPGQPPSLGLLPGERVLWSGRCAVAEYAFEEPASLPRWTLPEETEVFVTETRVVYGDPGRQVAGELRWPWPQHLRVQPGNRDTGRSATVTQIQLVCGGVDGTFPALVFAGGDLTKVADADRLANVLRHAIARYRVEHVAELGLTASQSRMLSRLVIAPEFSNYQGGEGQTVSLLGAAPVEKPAPAPAPEVYSGGSYVSHSYDADEYYAPDPYAADRNPNDPHAGHYPHDPVPDRYPNDAVADRYPSDPVADRYPSDAVADRYPNDAVPDRYPSDAVPDRYPNDPYQDVEHYDPTPVSAADWTPAGRPGLAADTVRAEQSHNAEMIAHQVHPDLASRAADLAARVASLVADGTDLDRSPARFEARTANLSAFLNPPGEAYASAETPGYSDYPTESYPTESHPTESEAAERAEAIRRTAARFAGNSARARGTAARSDDDLGVATRGQRYR